MAGNYPDVPGPRLAYDRDGSVGFVIDAGNNAITLLSGAELGYFNDESETGISARDHASRTSIVGIIFPELRDIDGYFLSWDGAGGSYGLQTSVDTTSGLDGTWTTVVAGSIPTARPVVPNYRTGIQAVSLSGIKAIRFTGGAFFDNTSWYAFHLYGKLHAGETPDRLRLWHPTLDQPLDDQAVSPDGAYFDWGNVPQGTTQDRTFRVKNNSSTLTANTITVSLQSLTPATTPDVFTLSDGGAFGSTVSIASLAAGALSGVLTLRRSTPANATLGLWAARIIAAATSWT